MKKLYFEDVECLCLDIVDKFENLLDVDDDISILAKYEVAKEAVSVLCQYYEIQSVHIERPEWDFYEDEYLISLNADGIWCMPAKGERCYLEDENTLLYVHEDCNSKVLDKITGDIVVEFAICEMDCECNGECCDCEEDCDFDEEFECDGDCEKHPCFEYGIDVKVEDLDYDEDGLHGFSLSFSDDESHRVVSYYSTEKLDNNRFEELVKMFDI